MNETEAREFRQNHDAYVRTISRLSKSKLAELYRNHLARDGYQILYGGPASKDELVNALTARQFPLDQLNESIHVLYHQDSDGWSACEHCHPHSGTGCDCALGRAAS